MASYKGNNDFRGYVAANAPEFLGFVGNDGGINQHDLKTAGGVESNYAHQSLDYFGAVKTINELYNKFQQDQVSQAANAGAANAGAAKADPNLDPTHIANLRGDIGNLMNVFKQAFAGVYAKIDQMAQDKKNQLVDKYKTSQQGLDQNYGNTSQGIDTNEAARGTFNSSYRATQQGAAQDAFNNASKQLTLGENADLAGVGQTAATEKAQLGASTPQYNPGDYNTVSDLLNVKNAVNQAIGNINVSGAGIGTQSGFQGQLNAIAPSVADTGSSQLKAQLDKLINTNAPSDTKSAIAKHAIDQAGADPAWLDYFHSQLTNTGSAAPATG